MTLNYVQNWKRYTELITYRMLHPWLAVDALWKLHPLNSEYQCIVSLLNKFADSLLSNHLSKSKLILTHNAEVDDSQEVTFVDELINAGYTQEEVHDEILSMLFGVCITSIQYFHGYFLKVFLKYVYLLF